MMTTIKRRLISLALSGALLSGAFMPRAVAADSDILSAIVGVLGTAGMYSGYLSAVLDAGNNAYYQEQTLLYDLQENGSDKNPADHAAVDRVMNRLVTRGDYVLDVRSLPFRWNVNDNSEFNAACFPTNYITVNKGLVRGLGAQEDELAAVLAHEMTHGVKLHSAYNYARAAAQSFGIAFLGMVTGKVSPDVVGVIADYSVAKNVILPAEYEADEGGFYLAASAGFNPGGAAAAMARMYWMSLHPESFDKSYDADPYDHPDTDKREAKLAKLLEEYSAGHVTVRDRSEILIDGEPLLKAAYSTEIYDDTPEQAYLIAGGLAKAFHDYTDFDGWGFRAGANGRVEYLSDEAAYSVTKRAVAAAHAEERLEAAVRSAYAGEAASGARESLAAREAKRAEARAGRLAKNAAASDGLVGKFYENADAYNDVFRPELSIAEGERSFAYEGAGAKRAGVYAARARAKSTLGDFASAMADADYAVSLDPNDAYVYLNRADVHRAMGEPEEALDDIDRSIALDKKAAPAYRMAADIEDELGRHLEARDHYAELRRLVPDAAIPDAYLKEIDPKAWEKLKKEREDAEKKRAEELKAARKNE